MHVRHSRRKSKCKIKNMWITFSLVAIILCLLQLAVTSKVGRQNKHTKKAYKVDTFEYGIKDTDGDFYNMKYGPNWESIDSRPLPQWFDQAKLGILIHWGVFSVPSFENEWFWWLWKGENQQNVVNFMKKNYPPDFTYQEFATQFKAEFFDPNEWADLFQESGAIYVVLTSKHHDGFTNWPSSRSWNWNSVNIGPHRDIVGELGKAIRSKTSIRFGLYYSLYEWFNPMFQEDQHENFTTKSYVNIKMMPELYDIVKKYEPDIVWVDGCGGANSDYWRSADFLAWLYNESPVKEFVVTNDRWGEKEMCKHGGYFTCEEKYNAGTLQDHKWEIGVSVDKKSWGYRENGKLDDYLTTQEIIHIFIRTISCGGNMLLNIGPTKQGIISPIQQERLKELGSWLKVNGEAVYSSTPWLHLNDSQNDDVWYTTKGLSVYAFVLSWPQNNVLKLGSPVPMDSKISLLGYDTAFLDWTIEDNILKVTFPTLTESEYPCRWAWVLKFSRFM